VEPSSEHPSEPGAPDPDRLAPLRAASVSSASRWPDRLRELVDEVRVGGPVRWLVAVVAVLAVAGGAVVVVIGRAAPTARTASLPFTSGAVTTVGAASRGSSGDAEPSGTTRPVELVVQAAGAVVRPGVYRLATGSRVADLLVAAGGMTPDADGDRVNQASALVDGARVYVPRVGEPVGPGPVSDGGGGGGGGSASPTSAPEPIDLNTATAEQLDTLPGVGPATAAAIIDYRQQHGPFHSVDDLAQVRGIGDAKLAQLRDRVRVG
jgi:competence protein ComEA